MIKLKDGMFNKDLAMLMLMYGATDMGKTSQLAQIAKWYANICPKKVIRMVTADSGTGPLQDEIAAGIVEVISLRRYAAPFGLLQKISQGYWPVGDGKEDPKTGKVAWQVRQTQDSEWEGIGGYFIEGTQAISLLLLGDHTMTNRKLSQDMMYTYSQQFELVDAKTGVKSAQSVDISGAAPAHYGDVQKFMTSKLIPDTGLLPVDMVVWTGHEGRGEDDTKMVKYGPATVGKAAIAETSQLFQHTIHIDALLDPKTGNLDRRAYFTLHPDLQSMNPAVAPKWEAKTSVPLPWQKELRERFKDGYVPLTIDKGMEQFLEFLREKQAINRAKANVMTGAQNAGASGTVAVKP